MPSSIRTVRRFAASVLAGCALAVSPAALAQPSGEFARFADADERSRVVIDYNVWTELLNGIVFDVGHSNRRPAMGRAQVTGSLLSPETNSRYRYENNRVVYHLMEDDHRELISAYRAELEALPSQTPLSGLSPNEQLAYWLNLHNVVVIDELAQRYPVRRLDTLRINGQPFHDAKLITIEGVPLSLNDIRLRIVGAGWDDPLVMYGFFSGAIGGPAVRNEAFTGARVWDQLRLNAREFVNALRGIDTNRRQTMISPLYGEHRDLFADWPMGLYAHLSSIAAAASDDLAPFEGEPAYINYDWAIADLTNGRMGCEGAINTSPVTVVSSGGSTSNAIDCRVLPVQARALVEVVVNRRLEFLRQGRLGQVTIRDVPTASERGDSEGDGESR
ncbi:DUF547 domain-containing protein [Alkalicaulis satelles]|uniref:DUF547 domain-containing protein n=1 Tax=Alkalicaulis satelles TaxID=2609175 RepID=A0A5M6ZG99_9PROT|nr:DUF547 domain-containing protein [Alkalicaulis satelles]KAA5803763.1 DUF547 domain-containing protein [Alkalicaulis satelles]